MKNLIILLLFLFTSTSLLAVNKETEKNYDETIFNIENSELINMPTIPTIFNNDLSNDEYGNCIIDVTITNSDGEKIATIHVDTNTETAQECDNLRDSIVDMAG